MYTIEHADDGWIFRDGDGKVLATHPTRAEAVADLNARFAATETAADTGGIRFRIPCMFLVGSPTGDKRILDDPVTYRDTPLPLMCQTITDDGHDGAVLAGRIDTVGITDGTGWGEGVFLTGENGVEAARILKEMGRFGISVDPGGIDTIEVEVLEVDEDGWPIDWIEHYIGLTVAGCTLTPFPAFAEAYAELVDPSEVPDSPDSAVAASGANTGLRIPYQQPATVARELMRAGQVDAPEALTAAAAARNAKPADWFTDPQLSELTPLTVTDDGRVYGHVAPWGECHIGSPAGACVTAPPSPTNYSYFRTGEVQTTGGPVAVGQITLAGGHAPTAGRVSASDAIAHYDDTRSAVADIVTGEDSHGIWFAGALRRGVTAVQVEALRASALSGDWRKIGTQLEMIAVLAVNTPGFPITRLAASGECLALVAAGAQVMRRVARDREDPRVGVLAAELASLRASVGPVLTERARARLAAARTDQARARLARASR